VKARDFLPPWPRETIYDAANVAAILLIGAGAQQVLGWGPAMAVVGVLLLAVNIFDDLTRK
jgi:hypothetical protein